MSHRRTQNTSKHEDYQFVREVAEKIIVSLLFEDEIACEEYNFLKLAVDSAW